jgi:hypothetical protein
VIELNHISYSELSLSGTIYFDLLGAFIAVNPPILFHSFGKATGLELAVI